MSRRARARALSLTHTRGGRRRGGQAAARSRAGGVAPRALMRRDAMRRRWRWRWLRQQSHACPPPRRPEALPEAAWSPPPPAGGVRMLARARRAAAHEVAHAKRWLSRGEEICAAEQRPSGGGRRCADGIHRQHRIPRAATEGQRLIG
eukprot:scaffold630_cov399-Prasinococcus_capsulatus_cf.AAC.1